MLLDVLSVSLLGGLLCLDRICLQVMISRPICAGPIIGLLLGDFHTGLIGGAFVELLWNDRVPIGTYVPPDDSLVAIVVVGAAVLSHQVIPMHAKELTALSMLLFVPLGKISQLMDTYIIKTNDTLSQRAVAAAENGDWRSVSRQHLTAFGYAYVFNVFLIAASLSAGLLFMIWLHPYLPSAAIHALTLMYYLLPLIGAAVALYALSLENVVAFFSCVCLAVLILLEFVHVF